MKRLSERVAVVTASTRGIGRACAERLAAEGAVVYLAARSAEKAAALIAEIEGAGGEARYVYFDAGDESSYAAMIERVDRQTGRLDILINNFGGTDPARDLDVERGESDFFFDNVRKNIASVYLPCKAALPVMARGGGGSIVNVSSIGSVQPDLLRVSYCVAKAAVNALTQNIAVQAAARGIRCNAVLPGLTATDAAIENMPQEFLDSFLRHVPLARMGHPGDMAGAVAFLASDDAAYVTGALLEAAGGFGLATPQYADAMDQRKGR